jgi:hypothetical protein
MSNSVRPLRVTALALRPRLSDESVVMTARPLDMANADLQDPRIQGSSTADGYARLLRRGQPLALIVWPDMSMAWVWLPCDQSVADALLQGYREGRARLEALHLQHQAALGSA